MILSIDSPHITPGILRAIANEIEKTWLDTWRYPYPYKILSKPKEILSELYPDIETQADTARDELDDVVIWLRGLGELHTMAIKELERKFPKENIKEFFKDIQEYHSLIVPHANEARGAVISINLSIDSEYRYIDLPNCSAIT